MPDIEIGLPLLNKSDARTSLHPGQQQGGGATKNYADEDWNQSEIHISYLRTKCPSHQWTPLRLHGNRAQIQVRFKSLG